MVKIFICRKKIRGNLSESNAKVLGNHNLSKI